jgi:hypothetical protein
MPDPDDLDPRTADLVRRFADAALVDFDSDQVAARATEPSRRPSWQIAAALAAALAVVVAVAVIGTGRGNPPSGAGPSEATFTTPPPEPSAPQSPAGGLTREEAIAVAREAAPQAADYPEVIRADAGPFGTQLVDSLEYTERPAPDRWVWVIMLCDGCGPLAGHSTLVILDYLDGRIYLVADFIG